MLGSFLVYTGLVIAAIAALTAIRPRGRLGLGSRKRSMVLGAAGFGLTAIGFLLPASDVRVARATTRLDEFMPVWQFKEIHRIETSAPPDSVFAAIKQVRADEIAFFRALTWIRRGGRELPAGILNAGKDKSIIDVALQGGFVLLAEDKPRELVIGTVVVVPPGTRGELTPDVFKRQLPPGFATAAMNFVVTPREGGGSRVSTETRVFANSRSARRRFAIYWRIIYPGSAIIRRMWLRAVRDRACCAPR